MIEDYLEENQDRYSPATLVLRMAWLEDLGRRGDLLGMTCDDLVEWRKELGWRVNRRGAPYSENTLHQAVGAARSFYRWALEKGLVKSDPTRLLKTAHVKRRPQLKLSASQVRQLLAGPDLETFIGIRDRALLGLVVELSLEKRACSRLDLGHLQMDTGALLTVSRGRRQIHSLTESLLSDLRFYLDHSRPHLAKEGEPALFVGRHGGRLSNVGVGHVVKQHWPGQPVS